MIYLSFLIGFSLHLSGFMDPYGVLALPTTTTKGILQVNGTTIPSVSTSKSTTYSPSFTEANMSNKTDRQSFTFSAINGDKNKTELNIGMKTTGILILTYLPGFYNTITIKASHKGRNIDVQNMTCSRGKSIERVSQRGIYQTYHLNTAFRRSSMKGKVLEMVTVSNSSEESNRRQTCEFEIYFHNSINLMDGQNISVIGYAALQTDKYSVTFTEMIMFMARTSILNKNKTAVFKLESIASNNISEVKSIKVILFQAWIPHYNPGIKVIIKRDAKFYDAFFAFYVRVVKVGAHFYPGANIKNLFVCQFEDQESDNVTLIFPSQWVNRGYYESENTTDDDLIEFEAGIALSESAIRGVNYSATIRIILNDTEAWSSVISLTAGSPNKNKTCQVEISGTSKRELSPCSNTSFTLKIVTPQGTSDTVSLNISTYEITGSRDTALVIEKIALKNTDTLFPCNCSSLTVSYNKTENSPIQNLAFVTLSYINSLAHKDSRSVSLIVQVRVDPGTARFGDTYVLSAVTDKSISKFNITVSKPEIFHDTNGDVLSKFNKILDGNESSCLHLPVLGEVPPLFWVKMSTTWLNISSSEYNFTVVGVHISCRPYGQRILQVSFPTKSSNNGFHGELRFCSLTFEDFTSYGNLTKCVYNCKCRNTMECGELVLFMGKHDNILAWGLCELYAKNVN